jgi:hypothetical protein
MIQRMAPNISSLAVPEISDIQNAKPVPYKTEIVWRNVIIMSLLHLSALYGLYLCIVSAKWQTFAFGIY